MTEHADPTHATATGDAEPLAADAEALTGDAKPLTADAAPSDLFAPLRPEASAEDVASRLLAAALGGMEMAAVHAGDSLGWYRALAEDGPLTSVELAQRTGTAERYVREWLEHQATSGYLSVVGGGVGAAATERVFRLDPGAAEALTDGDSLLHLAPAASFLAATGLAVDSLHRAYRTGGGVSWAELGARAREAQARLNRPMFLSVLTQEILPGLPDLHSRLTGGARVADVGCGEGWSAIGLALGYPDVTVDGYDIDEPSVQAAREHADDAGVSDRVTFTRLDAADAPPGGYDVVMAYECVHDMADPVAALAGMHSMVTADGYVLVMDERTEDVFTPRAGPVERLFYGFSILCCLPDGLSQPGGVGTGTVMRTDVLDRYARSAGYSRSEVLPVEHEMFRFYRLHL
jgi:hypothetical protein